MALWWPQAAGRYLLRWEQSQVDALVNDLFGFHALQVGLPALHALRANRMPHRWVAVEASHAAAAADDPQAALPPLDAALAAVDDAAPPSIALHCAPEALPFPDDSLDLVILPHTLEHALDAHDALREVERVLRPEGRVIIVGLNPWSLWGARQWVGHRLGGPLFLPGSGQFIGYRRVRDWLRLLSFEVESGNFGCWRPPLRSARWLERWRWFDRVGARALPGLGAVYVLQAVKRVRGMRLVGLARRSGAPLPARAPAVVAGSHVAHLALPTAQASTARRDLDPHDTETCV